MGRKALALVWLTVREYSHNNCSYMAAAIAYWSLFSLFPLVLAGMSILGFLHADPKDQDRIVEALLDLLPVAGEYLARTVDQVVEARGVLGAVAVVGLLLSGVKIFEAVRRGINQAWSIAPPHSFLLARAIDLAMLFGMLGVALVLMLVTTNLLGLGPFTPEPDGLGARVFQEAVGVLFTGGVLALLYRYVPNTSVAWREVWPGALVGAVLFQGIRLGFIWIVAIVNGFNLVYGSLGILMAVLAWVYSSSQALLLGAQLTAVYRQVFGSPAADQGRRLPAP